MPTYVYETIPEDPAVEPRRFEYFQGMNDAPLAADPETGEPVRRIITGGIGIKLKGLKRSTVVNKKSPAATACGCATGRSHRPATSGHRHGPGCGHKH
jgi:predicted nucleic acid-binding Zn ribbon protein